MTTTPIRILRATLAALALAASSSLLAQGYPTRPVTVIVPYLAGGPADTAARIVAHGLAERMGQPFVVVNRPGAGGNIGHEAIAHSAPDGYTVGIGGSTTGANVGLYPTLPYDPLKSFAPISIHYRDANILVVHPGSPINSVADLIALAKAKPGELTFSSSGNGTSTHLSGELFNKMAGVKMTHVPYKGVPPAIADVMGGQVTMMFASSTIVAPQVKAGKVKAIAVTGLKRLPAFPDLPTISEAGAAGLRGDDLDRLDGARGHAARDRRAAQPRGRRGAELARGARQARGPGLRGRREHARGDARADQGRHRQVGRALPRARHQGQLMPDARAASSFRLDGRVALVTAAGRGIGRATARAFANAGAMVIVNDVDADAAARVVEELVAAGARAEAGVFDVADEARVVAAIDGVASRHGRIDVLVNNAGVASRAASESLAREAWERTFAVNATGAFLCAREAGKRMLDAGRGAIVNVASVMGLVGRGLGPNGAYHASKGALVAWTRALACEWAARGVRVNAVAPGYVATPVRARGVRRRGGARAHRRSPGDRPARRAGRGRRRDPLPRQ